LRFEMKGCGGCRTCELACGFHHTGVFDPRKSSMRVIDRNDDEPGYFIDIDIFGNKEHRSCDGCQNLETPICVVYCHQADDLLSMIEQTMMEKARVENAIN